MSLVSFNPLWRPQKVSWLYPLDDSTAVIDRVRSKHARQFLRSLDQFLLDHQLSVELGECSFQDYQQFLELYRARNSARGFEILANEQWYQAKAQEGKVVEKVFVRQHGTLVGAKVITVKGSEIRSAYKASEQLPIFKKLRNASLGLVLDYLMLEEYVKRQPTLLMAGTSRNLFGVINTLGYLIFKLRMGYIPSVINPKTHFEQQTNVPEKPIWFSFLCDQPAVNAPLSLYYAGDLSQFSQATELERLIEIQPLSQTTSRILAK